MTNCEGTFSFYFGKFHQLTEYTAAVVPHVKDNSTGAEILVDSTIVLMMAWHEDFLKSLLSYGIRQKESQAREYLAAQGEVGAANCDLKQLIKIGRQRVRFKNRATTLNNLFSLLFGFPMWPSNKTRDRILDLNILRQLVVHHGGASLGDDYWDQLSDRSLVKTTRYGDLPAIRKIDYHRCVIGFLKDAMLALVEEAHHIRTQMLQRPEWTYREPINP